MERVRVLKMRQETGCKNIRRLNFATISLQVTLLQHLNLTPVIFGPQSRKEKIVSLRKVKDVVFKAFVSRRKHFPYRGRREQVERDIHIEREIKGEYWAKGEGSQKHVDLINARPLSVWTFLVTLGISFPQSTSGFKNVSLEPATDFYLKSCQKFSKISI